MSPICPLPVDWLDYLSGDGERSLAEHLNECVSCQTLLASLADTQGSSFNSDWANAFVGRTDAVWHEQSGKQPTRGEFWFSAPRFELNGAGVNGINGASFSYKDVDRVLLLVIDEQIQENDLSWVDVVPVLNDVERASETDLLFTENDSSLGGAWRALFAHQMKVATPQLDTCVGSLATVGAATLLAALEGLADESRWGAPLQGPFDPRAWLDRNFECVLVRLRTPWLLIKEAGLVDGNESFRANLRLLTTKPDELHYAHEAGEIYWLVPVKDPPHELALAAASAATRKPEVWKLDSPLVQLVGKLEVDWGKGVLVFLISAATLRAAVRVRLRLFAHGEDHMSEPFVPAKDVKVTLAPEVSSEAVEKLGAEVIT
jgi:hypothetical protein